MGGSEGAGGRESEAEEGEVEATASCGDVSGGEGRGGGDVEEVRAVARRAAAMTEEVGGVEMEAEEEVVDMEVERVEEVRPAAWRAAAVMEEVAAVVTVEEEVEEEVCTYDARVRMQRV
jgi:hypothetical protein